MNYESLMREQLPEYVYRLLKAVGRAGDRVGCPVFVVGGFVRDLIIGLPNLDVDIVVEGDGIAFAHAFAATENGEVRRHRRFGTAVVSLSNLGASRVLGESVGRLPPAGFKVDVATARTETYDHPGALPCVQPDSIREDLRRRDFTINAMAMRLNERQFGELVDFFGGRSDLQSGYIRILHDLSFVDDPTRIFRAIRFEQRYAFSIEPHTEKLLEKAVAEDFLKGITGQRLRNEILLILKEDDPIPTIRRMAHFDLLKYIHPRIRVSDALVELLDSIRKVLAWWDSAHSPVHSKAEPVLLNLLALLDQLNADEAESVSEGLALRKKYTEALRASKTNLPIVFQRMGKIETPPSEVYKMLKGLSLEVLLFAMAKTPGVHESISSYLTQFRQAKPLVNGNDLRELSYPEGPLYTQILDKTFAAQLDGLIADKLQAIQFIRSNFPV